MSVCETAPPALQVLWQRLSSLDVLGTDDLDDTAATVQGSIRPQVIGWYVLAALAAIAALAVIGQAIARQAASERADHPAAGGAGPATPRVRAG